MLKLLEAMIALRSEHGKSAGPGIFNVGQVFRRPAFLDIWRGLGKNWNKMRIGFDLRPFLREETGVGVYFRNLLFELARIDAENEYCLFSSSWKDRFRPDRVPPFRRKKFRDLRWPVKAVDFLWYKIDWPPLDYFFGERLDLTHSPSPVFLPTRGKKIITVHDLFFLDSPGKADRAARRNFGGRVGRDIEKADGIVAISQSSRRAILDRFPVDEKRIRVIPHGVDAGWRIEPAASELERVRRELDLPGEFLLFVGALEPRKNLVRLVRALKLLHDRGRKVPLLIVGRAGGDSARVKEAVERQGLTAWVRLAGYLDAETVRSLHHLATLLVFPSLAEGFGLPVLEAMAAGLPVATSGTSALPEVAGEAALFFDPEKPEEIAAQVGRLLDDQGLRRTLVERGKQRAGQFEWSTTAARTLEFYHAL
jgi:glycosyltransferase involved in cell wall biosynthesis